MSTVRVDGHPETEVSGVFSTALVFCVNARSMSRLANSDSSDTGISCVTDRFVAISFESTADLTGATWHGLGSTVLSPWPHRASARLAHSFLSSSF